MATTLLLNASRSTLMHASLANLTPELLVLDDIIHSLNRQLPPELLLIIRGHLLCSISADLIAQSAQALASYEQSLVSLLCADCASYNTDIYGPNAWDWPWDQFSGPCLCRGDIDDCLRRTKAFTDIVTQLQCEADKNIHIKHIAPLCRRSESGELFSKGELLQFSPQLLDAGFFLELHLSRQARRLARLAFKRYRSTTRGLAAIGSNSVPEHDIDWNRFLTIRSIWDAVKWVLRDRYGCEIIQPSDTISTPSPTAISFTNKSAIPCNLYDNSRSGRLNRHEEDSEIIELQIHEVESLSKIPALNGLVFGSASLTSRRQHERVYISLARPGYLDLRPYDHVPSRHTPNCPLTTINPEYRGDKDRSPLACNLSESLEEVSPTAGASPVAAAAAPVQDVYGISANNTEDPWISRALLGRAKYDLGLDIDYSSSYQISHTPLSSSSSSSSSGYYCSSCESGAVTTQLPTTSSGAESRSDPSSSPSSSFLSFFSAGVPATNPYPSTPCLSATIDGTATAAETASLNQAVVVAGESSVLEEEVEGGEVAIGLAGVTTGSSIFRSLPSVTVAQQIQRRGAEATTWTWTSAALPFAFATTVTSRLLSWSPPSLLNGGCSMVRMTGVKIQSSAAAGSSQPPPTPEAQLSETSTAVIAERTSTTSQLRQQQQQRCGGCSHRYAVAAAGVASLDSSHLSLTWSPPSMVLSFIESPAHLTAFFISLLRVVTTFLAACVCVPFAFVSFTLTILCFYSRPRSLRIL